MARIQRLLVAEGMGTRTLMQVARMAGYRNTSSVYNRMNSGEPIAGKFWKYYDATDRDLSDPTPAPGIDPLRKTIICDCGECKGKEWKPGGIHRAFPQIEGMRIWHYSFKRINELTGHNFQHAKKPQQQSCWTKPAKMADRLDDPARSRHVRAVEAQDVMPINPNTFIGANHARV